MQLSSVIPANKTGESVFGHRNFPRRERGSNLGPLAPEASAYPLSYHQNHARNVTFLKSTSKSNLCTNYRIGTGTNRCLIVLCYFPMWYPGSGVVWYLIVSIPDLCQLSYFSSKLILALVITTSRKSIFSETSCKIPISVNIGHFYSR